MDTRKWPRTMNEAFPKSAEYGCAIEQPHETGFKNWARAIAAICALGFITLLFRFAI